MPITQANLGATVKIGSTIQADEAADLLQRGFLQNTGEPGSFKFVKPLGETQAFGAIPPPATPRPVMPVPSFTETLAQTREAEVKSTQALIDAIRSAFQERVSRAQEEGRIRGEQQKSLSVRAGLAGSDIASAQAAGVRVGTEKEMRAIEAEQAATIAQAISKSDENAIRIAQLSQAEAVRGVEESQKEREKLLTESRGNAALVFKALGSQGKTFDNLSEVEKNSLRISTGFSDLALEGLFISSTPETQLLSKDPIIAGTKAIYFVKDPSSVTGFKKIELDTGEQLEDKKIIKGDDGIYVIDPKTGTFTKVGGEGVEAEKTRAEIEKIKAETAKIAKETTGISGEAKSLKNQALTSAQELLTKFAENKGAVGKSSIFGAIPGFNILAGRSDFVVQFNNLKSLLSLDNVKFLKGQGQVSDAERKLLAEASAKLDLAQSEGEFEKSLKSIIEGLSGKESLTDRIRIRLQDGQEGTIDENEFDPNTMTKI